MPDTAILLIHGIVGTPKQFNFLLPCIPDSWTVRNLLLEGHGGSVLDFSHSSMTGWERQVERALDELSACHGRVLVVGHSMGCLLALDAVLDRPERAEKLFLLAVPLYPLPRLRALTGSLRVIFDRVPPDRPDIAAIRDACGIQLDRRLWRYVTWVPRYLELFHKARRVRKRLPALSTPALAFQSRRDELVAGRSIEPLRRCTAVRAEVLEQSGHFYYPEADKARLREAFKTFLQ